MGWSLGYDDNWKRDIGYGVPAYCDAPGCNEEINRGLGFVCGGGPYGGEKGCGLFFCSKHQLDGYQRCSRCNRYRQPYKPKPDHPRWINWKLTDESWQKWREENPEEVAKLISAGTAPAASPQRSAEEAPET
jgi:hypothetical protein